jgi:hypothetical protein
MFELYAHCIIYEVVMCKCSERLFLRVYISSIAYCDILSSRNYKFFTLGKYGSFTPSETLPERKVMRCWHE